MDTNTSHVAVSINVRPSTQNLLRGLHIEIKAYTVLGYLFDISGWT